jgi:hypothetical protein
MVLERLEAKHLGDHIPGSNMPPQPTSRFLDATILSLSSQHPVLPGGHVATSRVP